MKAKAVYVCNTCGKEYKHPTDAYKCEAEHLGIDMEEYRKYMDLLKEERKVFRIASTRINDEVRGGNVVT